MPKQDSKAILDSLTQNTSDGYAHFKLGRAYRDIKDYESALQEFSQAIRLGLNEPEVNLEMGRTYREKKELDRAITELEQALQLGLDNDEVHLELGRVYRERKQYLKAIEEFKAALRYRPSEARIHMELGWVYNDNEDYDLAVKELEQAGLLGIDDDEFHISLGRMYRKAGEYELSAEEFRKAIEKISGKDDVFLRNKMLNEIEISQKKEIIKSWPRYLGVTLTSRCNLRCIMCTVRENNWDIPYDIVKEIMGFFPYLEHIIWQGGEVFILDYFKELFQKAASYPNLKQTIVTNGLLIDEEWAEKLTRCNADIIFSIDGVTKKTYEYIRRGARFDDLIKSIDILNAFKEKYSKSNNSTPAMSAMQVVVMRSNYQELGGVIEFARSHKFNRVLLQPVNGNFDNGENIFFNNEEKVSRYIGEIMKVMKKEAQDSGIKLIEWLSTCCESRQDINHGGIGCKKGDDRKKNGLLCYAPWQQMIIEWGGEVYPHCHCIQGGGSNESKRIGNVLEGSLTDIWNGERMQLFRKKIIDNDFLDLCNPGCLSGLIPSEVRDVPSG